MLWLRFSIVSSLAALQLATVRASLSSELFLGSQSVNLWRLRQFHGVEFNSENTWADQQDHSQSAFAASKPKPNKFPERWFEQPLDHFTKDSPTFGQRYWVNNRHYKKGGPVIVLDGGETSGTDRIPFLDTGIVEILAKATGGLGVVLEHRYYGNSSDPIFLPPYVLTDEIRKVSTGSQLHDRLSEVSVCLKTLWFWETGDYTLRLDGWTTHSRRQILPTSWPASSSRALKKI